MKLLTGCWLTTNQLRCIAFLNEKKQKKTSKRNWLSNAFDDIIEDKKVPEKDLNKIKAYILKKYQKEIDKLIPCDYNEQITKIKKFKAQ